MTATLFGLNASELKLIEMFCLLLLSLSYIAKCLPVGALKQ